jgi:hypothetical protein
VDALGGDLDKGGGPRLVAAEPDPGGGPEGAFPRAAGPVGEVQGDVVPAHVEQAGPLGRLDLGEVSHSGHAVSPSASVAGPVVIDLPYRPSCHAGHGGLSAEFSMPRGSRLAVARITGSPVPGTFTGIDG